MKDNVKVDNNHLIYPPVTRRSLLLERYHAEGFRDLAKHDPQRVSAYWNAAVAQICNAWNIPEVAFCPISQVDMEGREGWLDLWLDECIAPQLPIEVERGLLTIRLRGERKVAAARRPRTT
jgi:hypothetical protein